MTSDIQPIPNAAMVMNRTIDSYRFGFSMNLTESQLQILKTSFQNPERAEVSVLGGRTSVTHAQLDGVESFVIKHYRRGGLLRYCIKRRYFKFGKTRAQREFELLKTVGALGINVPEPIAFAHRGRLFYMAWLVTREIKGAISLARLSLSDEMRALRAMKSVTEQISRLIDHGIWHVDLHPGNVMIDHDDRVFLLDFDRGQIGQRNRPKLRNRYISRWIRSVSKHKLPTMFSDMIRTGLEDLP